MQLYGSASAEPFFCPFSGEQGSTTAHLRRLPRKGRARGAYKTLLKHRVQGAALPAMLPSSPSADYISDATLRLCFGRAVFVAPFPENRGARLRISGGCPARGEPEALTKLCSSIACRAQPCQRCSPVLQALIIFQMQLYGSASAEPFFAAPFSGEQGSTTAHLRRLPRKGRAGGAYKTLLKHRVQGAALPAMLPSSPSADYISDATLRLCFGRAVFVAPFPENRGARLRISDGCPARGEPEALIDLCSSIAC